MPGGMADLVAKAYDSERALRRVDDIGLSLRYILHEVLSSAFPRQGNITLPIGSDRVAGYRLIILPPVVKGLDGVWCTRRDIDETPHLVVVACFCDAGTTPRMANRQARAFLHLD